MASLLHRRTFLAVAATAISQRARAIGGRKAPSFETKSLIGRRIRLEDYRGKSLVLVFWATWCPHCRRYLAAMDEMYAEFEKRGVAMLALSTDKDGWKDVAPYIRDHKLGVSIALATPSIQRAYDTSGGIPYTVIIDPDGYQIREFVGAPNAQQLRGLLELLAKKE